MFHVKHKKDIEMLDSLSNFLKHPKSGDIIRDKIYEKEII